MSAMLSESQVKTAVHRWYKAYRPEELHRLTQLGDLGRILERKAQPMLSEWHAKDGKTIESCAIR